MCIYIYIYMYIHTYVRIELTAKVSDSAMKAPKPQFNQFRLDLTSPYCVESGSLGVVCMTVVSPSIRARSPSWEFPKVRGTYFWGSYNKDPTI